MTERLALLVLGASRYQLPVIERARQRGYRVITTDNVPANPGHALADVSYAIDTTDADGVVAIASREDVDGVIAPCTDVAVPTAAVVASRLGLPGVPAAAAAVLCDKIRFRSWQAENELPCPHWSSAAAWPGAGAWVLKPAASSGSKGIFIVGSEAEFAARLPETLAFGGRALIEQFIPGQQVTCEGLLRDGELVASWVTSRETAPAPFVATWGHVLPSGIGAAAEQAVIESVIDILHRLDVSSGPFDADVVWDGTRAWVLEATARLGGNSLGRLIRIASGVDLIDEALDHALGLPFGRTPTAPPRPSAILLFGVDRAGLLHYDKAAVAALAAEPWMASIEMDREPGDPVEPFINGRHRVGEALVTAPDVAALEQRCREVRTRLGVSIRP